MKKRGFSLVEIALIILVILIVMSLGIYAWKESVEAAKASRAKSEISVMASAISQYRYELGHFPASINVLADKDGQYGPWITKEMADSPDPWQNKYLYVKANDNSSYIIYSFGPDKKDNGSNLTNGIMDGDIGFKGR